MGKQDLPGECDSAKLTATRPGNSGAVRRMKPLEGRERSSALQKARGFNSEHPFVKVLLQSSSANFGKLPL